ncbi:MAG: glycosyltransferase [Nanoarchaeota archaeon]|nr:glycosyltransferase [Nanoarchaeota archaeon]
MKLTFLTLAGIENSTTKRVFYIAKELKKRGHEINFLSLNWVAKKGSAGKGNELIEGIKVKEIKIKDSLFSIFLVGPLRLFPKLNGDLIVLSKPLLPHTIPFLLANFFKRKKYVLDTDDWEGVGGGASYSHFGWLKRSMITLFEEYIMNKADGVIAVSRVLERRSMDAGAKKVAYIPNVSDVGDFDVKEEEKEKLKKEFGINNEKIFLSSGSHSADMVVDGIKFFIEGFGKAKGNFKIIITGQGKYTENLKQLCNKLGLKDKVIFTGFVDDKKFSACVIISHVAIIPHATKYPYTLYALSSSPRKMYEAMASGLAVLGCPVGEVKETLGGSDNFLVPEGDVDALAKKIDEIIKMDNNKLKAIGLKNKEKINEFYNFKVQGENVERFLRTIL